MKPVLSITDLHVHFPGRKGAPVRAVDGVSLDIAPGETLGLVGESGCGKSSLSNAVVGLVAATSGSIDIEGNEIVGASRAALRDMRARVQMVFQDPATSLNPRMTIGDAIGEPLLVRGLASGDALRTRVAALLEEVGLRPEHADRMPHQFSGGQRQRVVIARALAPCWCATNPSARWMSRCARKFSICWWICSPASAWPRCSSRTTLRWSAMSVIAWP
jgi:oligopeptide transport system ATP-binding protein